jgi:hypothetical protein
VIAFPIAARSVSVTEVEGALASIASLHQIFRSAFENAGKAAELMFVKTATVLGVVEQNVTDPSASGQFSEGQPSGQPSALEGMNNRRDLLFRHRAAVLAKSCFELFDWIGRDRPIP